MADDLWWCEQLYRNICFNQDYISSCTTGNSSNSLRFPKIIENYNGENIDWSAFFEERQKVFEDFKNGIVPEICQGCQFLQKFYPEYIDTSLKLSYIQLSHYLDCNADCVYCNNHKKPKLFKKNSFDSYPIVKELIDGNYIEERTAIDFAGGEPTMYNRFNDIIKLIINESKCRNIIVHTNAIKYSKFIEEGIRKGILNICISPDSGTATTFARIKQVKKFNVVWKNIKRYANAKQKDTQNQVRVKYNITLGYNDNKEELIKWIILASEAKATCLVLNADCNIYVFGNDTPEVMDKLVELSDTFVNYCKEHNINWEVQYNVVTAYLRKKLPVPGQN